MDSANNIGTIAWGSNASGGDVSVSSLYDLREVLDRIGAAVELSPQHDGTTIMPMSEVLPLYLNSTVKII